jgi:predicted nucleic acid-binding protein
MGRVVLHSSVVLGLGSPEDRLHHASVAALAEREHLDLVLPVSVFSEVLLGAFRLGERTAVRMEEMIDGLVAEIRPIGRAAAMIRARRKSVRLPDALVLATGVVLDAEVLTGDNRWRDEPGHVTVIEP